MELRLQHGLVKMEPMARQVLPVILALLVRVRQMAHPEELLQRHGLVKMLPLGQPAPLVIQALQD